MLRRGASIVLGRWMSTAPGLRRVKGLNLTPYVSPLLFRLHPDTVHRQAPALAQKNEQALKQLNVFLELATFGCNNDAFNARKHVLGLEKSSYDLIDEPIRFPLVFYVSKNDSEVQEHVDGFARVSYTVEIPGRLVKYTLSNFGRLTSLRDDPEAALQAPFAREWQRTTKRILQDLFQVAQVPLAVGEGETKKDTALAEWLAEEDTIVDQAEKHGVRVGEHNRVKKRELVRFNNVFNRMLTREMEIVQVMTTGLEVGPTTQHAILTNLLHSRLLLPKFQDSHTKKSAFHWIANVLLVNFKDLHLHSLVWNKITLLLSVEAETNQPQVSWDENSPELGMGILIPLGMDVDALVDFLISNVEVLEIALEQNTTRAQAPVKEQQKLKRKKNRRQSRRGHFYQNEVNAIFRWN